MTTSLRPLWVTAALSALTVLSSPSIAQSDGAARYGNRGATNSSSGSDSYSLLPYTKNGYVGLNIGSTQFNTSCGANPAFGCEDSDGSFHIYTGGLINPYWGLELGYMHEGKALRGGGDTKAQGIHLSVLGRLPLGDMFSVYGKVGALYSHTHTSAAASSGIPTGSESGWGPSYAVGVSWDVNRSWSLMLEQERNEFHFSGVGRQAVESVNLGVKYKF